MVESTAEFYSKHAEKQDDQYSRESVSEKFLEIRDSFLDKIKGSKILDVGCGPGYDTEYFLEQGFSATGIDIAEGMIEYAKKNRKGGFRQMNAQELEFKDSTFDGVWCTASIFFMPKKEMEKALAEFKRVMKDDGTLYVDFKLGDGEYLKEKWGDTVKEWHLSKSEIEDMLDKQEFYIAESNQNITKTGNRFLDIFAEPKESK